MNERLQEALENRVGNHILPFLWMHGEPEALIREGVRRVQESGIGELCVESRPHPDFLGDKWWADLDVVMDEAKKRGMRVWVLDDAHFPSGMCNGKIGPDSPYGKDYLTHVCTDVAGPMKRCGFMVRLEPGERLLGVVLGRVDRTKPDALAEAIDLTAQVRGGKVCVDVPEGTWSAMVLKTTRRGTGRRNYINTIDRDAVRFFIDTVYEPHRARYASEFGATFAGFFSDEPEIGNGMSEHGHHLRAGQPDINLPWCAELEARLKALWGDGYALHLASLFAEIGSPAASAVHRVQFTDIVAALYGRNFCGQIGDWCRDNGVEYIGHVIEDDGRHAQLGLGTAHFFRALWGQDMAGIDVVLQQLRPGLDDFCFHTVGGIGTYNGEFFHYGLAKLGASLAKLDPKKRGRTVCEVFGAYGWAEGLKQMKWILDHMLVNGINYFVPHAFTMKDFPDPDCPPHFYARGNNPQYPYFRHLMTYANRVSHLISGGTSRVSAAILYTAEQEWAGETIQFEKAAKALARAQIDHDVIPADCLCRADVTGGRLPLGEGEAADAVSALIVCGSDWLDETVVGAIRRAASAGVRVYLLGDRFPGVLTADGGAAAFPEECARLVDEDGLIEALRADGACEIRAVGEAKWLRWHHYARREADYLLFFNESPGAALDVEIEISGEVRGAQWYDPWMNGVWPCPDGASFRLELPAGELRMLVLPRGAAQRHVTRPMREGRRLRLPDSGWRVALCGAGASAYEQAVFDLLTDVTSAELCPDFSGTMRYEIDFDWSERVPESATLDLGEVFETAQVFLNGLEVGVRVAPPYRFPVDGALSRGTNRLQVVVVNTLVHRLRDYLSMTMPIEPSGLLGPVEIIWEA